MRNICQVPCFANTVGSGMQGPARNRSTLLTLPSAAFLPTSEAERVRRPRAQICCTSLSAARLRRGKPWRSVEAVQARGLDHPGIVRTYKTTTVLVQVGN
jgi:hypothetical protein